MTVRSLSFTPVQFFYFGLSWETYQKSAVFQREAKLEPLSTSLQDGLHFFWHPLPTGQFRFPYGRPTHLQDESPLGLPCFACLTYD